MQRFLYDHRLISSFFFISLFVIAFHFLSLDKPECFPHAEEAFDVLQNLAIGYVVNCFFYVTQIYIPSEKRNKIIYSCISERLEDIGNVMTDIFKGITGENKPYVDNFFEQLLKIQLDDFTKIGDASKSNRDRIVYFTVRQLLWKSIYDVNAKIDTVISYYKEYLEPEVMNDLEAIKGSLLHTAMVTILVTPNDCRFNLSKSNFYKQYYELAEKLLEDNNKFYSTFD